MVLVLSIGLLLYYFKIFTIELIVVTTLIAAAFEVKLWKETEKKFKEYQLKEKGNKKNV